MNTLFYTVLNMSAVGAIVTVFVVFARLLLKKSPKIFSYILWSAVLFRLICPVSFSLPFSAIPESISRGIFTESEIKDFSGENFDSENSFIQANPGEDSADGITASLNAPSASESDNQTSLWKDKLFSALIILWIAGAAAMASYSVVSFIKLKKKLGEAVLLKENIYVSDKITTPLVTGIFSPKIYLPVSVKKDELEYIILHERCHIKRGDNIVKMISFAVLCFHWFNPFIWLAFCLSNRDMEMSCDEAVMKKMKEDVRASYSSSLLNLSAGRPVISGTPLAFGESSVKQRIKNIMKYKKPAVIISVISAIAIVILSIIFIGNPVKIDEEYIGVKYKINECLWVSPSSSITRDALSEGSFFVSSEGGFYSGNPSQDEYIYQGKLKKMDYSYRIEKSLALSIISASYNEETENQAKEMEKLLKNVEDEIYVVEKGDSYSLLLPCKDGNALIINVIENGAFPIVAHVLSVTAKGSQEHPNPMGEFAAKDALNLDEVPRIVGTARLTWYMNYVLQFWKTDDGMGYTVSQEEKYLGEYRYKHVTSKFYPNDEKTGTLILCDTIEIKDSRKNFKFDFAIGNIPGVYEVFAIEKGSSAPSASQIDTPLGTVAAPEREIPYIVHDKNSFPEEYSTFGSCTVSDMKRELLWYYVNSAGEKIPINPYQK